MNLQLKKLFQVMATAACLLPAVAKADDTSLFTLGGTGGSSNWPTTVIFDLDTSGSMLFHTCEDCFSWDSKKRQSPWYKKSVGTHGAEICSNYLFDALVGVDVDGDGVRDPYRSIYLEDGVTWRGTTYNPILDNNSGEGNQTYRSCSIWYPNVHSGYKDVGEESTSRYNPTSCGRGLPNEKKLFDAEIKKYCNQYENCAQANRCIFSLRTQGYYSEACGASKTDPYGACNDCYKPDTVVMVTDPNMATVSPVEVSEVSPDYCDKEIAFKPYIGKGDGGLNNVNGTDQYNWDIDAIGCEKHDSYYTKHVDEKLYWSAASTSFNSFITNNMTPKVSFCEKYMTFSGGGILSDSSTINSNKTDLELAMLIGKPFWKPYGTSYRVQAGIYSPGDKYYDYNREEKLNPKAGVILKIANNGDGKMGTQCDSTSEVRNSLTGNYVVAAVDEAGTLHVYLRNYKDGGVLHKSYDKTTLDFQSGAKCVALENTAEGYAIDVYAGESATCTGDLEKIVRITSQTESTCSGCKFKSTLQHMSENDANGFTGSGHFVVGGAVSGGNILNNSYGSKYNNNKDQHNGGKNAKFGAFKLSYHTEEDNVSGVQWDLSKITGNFPGIDQYSGEQLTTAYGIVVEAEDMTAMPAELNTFIGLNNSRNAAKIETNDSGAVNGGYVKCISSKSAGSDPAECAVKLARFPGPNYPTYSLVFSYRTSGAFSSSTRIGATILDVSGNVRSHYYTNISSSSNWQKVKISNVEIQRDDQIVVRLIGTGGIIQLDNMEIHGSQVAVPTVYGGRQVRVVDMAMYDQYAGTNNNDTDLYRYYPVNNGGYIGTNNKQKRTGSASTDSLQAVFKVTPGVNYVVWVKLAPDSYQKFSSNSIGFVSQTFGKNGNTVDSSVTIKSSDSGVWAKLPHSDKCSQDGEIIRIALTTQPAGIVYEAIALMPGSAGGGSGCTPYEVPEVSCQAHPDGFNTSYEKNYGGRNCQNSYSSSYCAEIKDKTKSPLAYLGDWMNFNPRRDHQVASALYTLMDDLVDDVRVGFTYYSDVQDYKTYDLHKSSSGTANILPNCSTVGTDSNCTDGDKDTACFTSADRAKFKSEIYNFRGKYNTGTPTAEVMDHVAYIAGLTEKSKSVFCDKCQSNAFMVVLTDGVPSGNCEVSGKVSYGCFDSTKGVIGRNSSSFKDGLAYNNNYLMDEVAYVLANYDVMNKNDSVENVINTYTISFALANADNPDKCPTILEQTAHAGGGTCLPAYDITSLREALTTIIKDITPRAMTYTAPSVSAVRGSGEDNIVTSTFVPGKSMPFWESHVYKFELCDEKEGTGCSCGDASNNEEMCIVGKDDNIVSYENGRLKSEPFWDAQLCLSGDYLGMNAADNDLDPWHKNVTNCYRSASETSENRRKIYTVVPRNTDGVYDQSDSQIEFVSNNATNLSSLKNAFKLQDENEAKRLIGFLRGADVDDFDFDGNTTEDRSLSTLLDGAGNVVDGWWKLGDIFHSSPLMIGGLSDSLDVASYRSMSDANVGFKGRIKNRRAIYLMGANDGMLHAFDGGYYNDKDVLVGDTGAELWAFIMPSHLEKLPNMCRFNGTGCAYDNKLYFVDATPTYRDVFTGGLNDDLNSTANSDKWKTIVIGGMRQGGNSYYALDLTDTTDPKFLWEFPPYTQEARSRQGITENFGETWLNMGSNPSPIGAIPVGQQVKYVALLGAGYDRFDTKGRGYYLVDPYTGNVLYSAQYTAGDSDLKNMKYSFAASPAFTSPKPAETILQTQGMQVFGAIIALDHGGQVWVQDIGTGTTMTNNKLNFANKPQVRFRANSSLIAPGLYQDKPIFFLPVTVKGQNGKLRAVFGTGDRDKLLPEKEGEAIDRAVCEHNGYIYNVVVEANACSETRPCQESDLAYSDNPPSKQGDRPSKNNDKNQAREKGWYYKLRAGERVVNPPSLMSYRKTNGQIGGILVITTFQANVCSSSYNPAETLKTCGNNDGSVGIGRTYLLDVETGVAYKDTIEADGSLPADPRITTKVGDSVETAIILPGNKDNPTPTVQREVTQSNPMEKLFDVEIGRDVHNTLHN